MSIENNTKHDIDIVNGHENFVSLSHLCSFSDDNKHEIKHLSSSLVVKKTQAWC